MYLTLALALTLSSVSTDQVGNEQKISMPRVLNRETVHLRGTISSYFRKKDVADSKISFEYKRRNREVVLQMVHDNGSKNVLLLTPKGSYTFFHFSTRNVTELTGLGPPIREFTEHSFEQALGSDGLTWYGRIHMIDWNVTYMDQYSGAKSASAGNQKECGTFLVKAEADTFSVECQPCDCVNQALSHDADFEFDTLGRCHQATYYPFTMPDQRNVVTTTLGDNSDLVHQRTSTQYRGADSLWISRCDFEPPIAPNFKDEDFLPSQFGYRTLVGNVPLVAWIVLGAIGCYPLVYMGSRKWWKKQKDVPA